MNIADKLSNLKVSIPDHVELVAVSKTKPTSVILEDYNAGQRIFGENRVQELALKYVELPKDIEWHLIGHLQTNKVKYIAGFVTLIHAIDSLKLLLTINKEAKKHDRIIDCLLQIHIAKEETKYGFGAEEIVELLAAETIADLTNINIKGLMGMATFTADTTIIKNEFSGLKNLFDQIESIQAENFKPSILSMGMSGDYEIAIEAGSNMIRIGSLIFGERS